MTSLRADRLMSAELPSHARKAVETYKLQVDPEKLAAYLANCRPDQCLPRGAYRGTELAGSALLCPRVLKYGGGDDAPKLRVLCVTQLVTHQSEEDEKEVYNMLLKEAQRIALQNSFAFILLDAEYIPDSWHPDYAPIEERFQISVAPSHRELQTGREGYLVRSAISDDASAMLALLERVYEKQGGGMKPHTGTLAPRPEQLHATRAAIIDLYRSQNSPLLTVITWEGVCGYLLEDRDGVVTDLVADDPQARRALVQAHALNSKAEEIVYRLSAGLSRDWLVGRPYSSAHRGTWKRYVAQPADLDELFAVLLPEWRRCLDGRGELAHTEVIQFDVEGAQKLLIEVGVERIVLHDAASTATARVNLVNLTKEDLASLILGGSREELLASQQISENARSLLRYMFPKRELYLPPSLLI